jgi:hypothetical protein
VVISDHQLHAAQAAVGEAAQEVGPERLGLRATFGDARTSRLPSSFTATAIITARLMMRPACLFRCADRALRRKHPA